MSLPSNHPGDALATSSKAPAPGTYDANLEDVAACLFCGSDHFDVEADRVRDYFFAADDGEFTYVRCRDCASLWLKARPTGARLMQAYTVYYTHAAPQPTPERGGLRGVLRNGYLRARFAAESGPVDNLIDAITHWLGRDNSNIDEQFRFTPKAPARILDYGCGSGEYLLRMAPFGHRLHGIEYDPHLLTALSERGIAIDDVATLSDDQWHEDFDHITLAHVLEHVPDPAALLQRLFKWLKPGGTLFIEVPNGEATGLEIFGRYWRGLEAPRHFSLSNRASTIAALEQAGFQLIRQHINNSVRQLVWDLSLEVCPTENRAEFEAAIASAPPVNETNAEFLTFVAKRPG